MAPLVIHRALVPDEAAAVVRALSERNRILVQLVSEAVAALDSQHADHERIDVRDWLRAAKAAIGEA